MILKGSQRAEGGQLAAHLLNDRDNDHVRVHELRGFVADDLRGAFDEAHAISKATRCKQYLFSLSLNPPKDADAKEEDFERAADEAEKRLGLEGQPRAIVIHEKEGRRHAHVVWSRIDANEMRAINLPFFKTRLTELSRELYLEHEWTLPDGLRTNGGKSPLNFTLDEWQQAKRLGSDPREIKDTFRDAWQRSDSLPALRNALEERGYYLAHGDRRGIVAIDVDGEVFALARWSGVKTKDLREKLGDGAALPSVADAKHDLSQKVGKQLKAFIGELRQRHAHELAPVRQELAALKTSHTQERDLLNRKQAERWAAESDARAKRLRNGLAGLWDKLSGKAKAIRHENEAEAMAGLARDRAQRDGLSLAQRKQRQTYQADIDRMKLRHAQDRRLMAREVSMHLRKLRAPPDHSREPTPEHERTRRRGGFSLDL